MIYLRSESLINPSSEAPAYVPIKLKKSIISPESKYLNCWNILIALILLYTILVSPCELAFENLETPELQYIDYLIDLLFFADVIINSVTAFYDAETNLVNTHKKIFLHYLKRWMLVDIIACIPFQVIADSGKKYNSMLRVSRVQRIYKILRIARLLRLVKLLKNAEQRKYLDLILAISIEAKRLIWFLLFFALFLHLITCFWVFVGGLNMNISENWIQNFSFASENNSDLYITSLYWSITTLVTVGYGDIFPISDPERICSIVIMLTGILAYSYTISSISNLVRTFNLRKTKLNKKLEILAKLGKIHKFSNTFQKKIADALEYDYRNHDKEFEEILKDLPRHLSQKVLNIVFEHRISQNFFFSDKPEHFRAWVASRLKPLKIGKLEFIYKQNEFASEMYFLTKGSAFLAILRGKEYIPCIVFQKFYYFGEIDLLFSVNKVHLHTVFTSEGCEMLTLSSDDFMKMMECFEEESIKICLIARERFERTRISVKEAEIEVESEFSIKNHLSVPQNYSISVKDLKSNSRKVTEVESIFKDYSLFSKINEEKIEQNDLFAIRTHLRSLATSSKQLKILTTKLKTHLNSIHPT